MVQQPPSGWVLYTNSELGFSAFIPEHWEVEEHPSESGNPAKGISIAAPLDEITPDAIVISIVAIPYLEAYDKPISTAELKRSAEDWIADSKLRIIKSVEETEIDSHSAVWMIHESDATDGSYTVRGYAAFVSTTEWLYYLEVAGLAEYDSHIEKMYKTFTDSFKSLEQQ